MVSAPVSVDGLAAFTLLWCAQQALLLKSESDDLLSYMPTLEMVACKDLLAKLKHQQQLQLLGSLGAGKG